MENNQSKTWYVLIGLWIGVVGSYTVLYRNLTHEYVNMLSEVKEVLHAYGIGFAAILGIITAIAVISTSLKK